MPFFTIQKPKPSTGDGGLRITYPAHYQVMQRDLLTNKGSFVVAGTFSGYTNGIEARWNGGPWQLLDTDPKNGVFRGVLTNLTPGQGTLEVRFVDSPTNTRKKWVVGVADNILLIGQSNCVGGFQNFQSYSNPVTASFLSKGYQWKPLADPFHYNDSGFDSVFGAAGANGSSGSYWPLLADHMMDAMGIPVAFIPCAKVGVNILEYMPGDDHLDRSTLYGVSLYRGIQAGGVREVWIHQGEANVNDTQPTYLGRISTVGTALADDLEAYTGIRPKIRICKIQAHATNDYSNLWAAVQQFWDEHPDAAIGADLSGIQLTTTPPEDGLHLTTNAQAIAAAQAWHVALTNDGFYI